MSQEARKVNKKNIALYIANGELETVKYALNNGLVNLDEHVPTDQGREFMLNIAVRQKQPEITQYLLEQGADFQQKSVTRMEDKPLFLAMETEQKDIFSNLLERYAILQKKSLRLSDAFLKQAFSLDDPYYMKEIAEVDGRCEAIVLEQNIDKAMQHLSGGKVRKMLESALNCYNAPDIVENILQAAMQNNEVEFARDFARGNEACFSFVIERVKESDKGKHDAKILGFALDALFDGRERTGDLYADTLILCLEGGDTGYQVTHPIKHLDLDTLLELRVGELSLLAAAVQQPSEYTLRAIREKANGDMSLFEAQDDTGKTLLMHAVLANEKSMLYNLMNEYGLGRNANLLNAKDHDGLTVADYAQRSTNYQIRHYFRNLKEIEQWVISDDCEISHIREKDDLGLVMTEIFNFEALERTTLVQTKGEHKTSSIQRDAFDALPNKKILSKAFNKYQLIKNDAPDDVIEAMKAYTEDQGRGARLPIPRKNKR